MRYFAQAADKVGCREEVVEISGNDQNELRTLLVQMHPALDPVLDYCRFAVNGEYIQQGEWLPEGAEVAVIPPVSGG